MQKEKRMSRDLQYLLYQKLYITELRRTRGNILKLFADALPPNKKLRRITTMSM